MAAIDRSSPGRGPTVNPARLAAGDASFVDELATNHSLLGSDRQINVVPDRALVEGEARFLKAEEGREMESALGDLARDLGVRDEVEISWWTGNSMAPVDPLGRDRALSHRAVALAAAAGWTLELEEDRGGLSFPNFLPPGSTMPILDGLGPIGGGMHTREEWVSLVSLERRTRLLADLLVAEVG
jgi:glutamate carboxypeptidase